MEASLGYISVLSQAARAAAQAAADLVPRRHPDASGGVEQAEQPVRSPELKRGGGHAGNGRGDTGHAGGR
jgi:hypothetical protein